MQVLYSEKKTKPQTLTINTAIFLILSIIKYSMFFGHLHGSESGGVWVFWFCFFLSGPNPNYGLSDNGTKYLFCPLGCSILSSLKGCKKC